MSLGADVRRLVSAYEPRSEREHAEKADFLAFFADDHGPVAREDGPDHATASALVFDPSLTRTLLVFHGKGRFWVQPGGHLEPGDASIADAALREMQEETGVAGSVPASFAYDLDHHALSAAFGRCSSHLDIGVAVVVEPGSPLLVSAESEDVRWWPIDALPAEVPDGFAGRVERLRGRLWG
ncbi:NTP pyrophosphohydrolase [Microbacterium sp. HM58-2]|nr:NTP pyrophosphohydrolase [Microbacterium sp. HM58-2]